MISSATDRKIDYIKNNYDGHSTNIYNAIQNVFVRVKHPIEIALKRGLQ